VRYIALALGALLCGIGILHAIINVRSVTRAIARGEIVERMGAQLVANVVLAGLALVILGSFLLLIASDLEKGKRSSWRIAFVVGVFLTLSGVAGLLVAAATFRLYLLRDWFGAFRSTATLAKPLFGGMSTRCRLTTACSGRANQRSLYPSIAPARR
jgi:hypothetical protein